MLLLWLLPFLLLSLPLSATVVTRDEANIAGVLWNDPFIVAEFLISKTYPKVLLLSVSSPNKDVESNIDGDLISPDLTSRHIHSLTAEFCQSRRHQCTNREYYLILDKMIDLLSDTFYHRLKDLTEVLLPPTTKLSVAESDIDHASKGNPVSNNVREQNCRVKVLHQAPSSKEFYQFVKNSQPFIIRSPKQQQQQQQQYQNKKEVNEMWSLKNLLLMFGNATVIVNASPTSDFDGVS